MNVTLLNLGDMNMATGKKISTLLFVFIITFSTSAFSSTIISENFDDKKYTSPLSMITKIGYDGQVNYSSTEKHGSTGFSVIRDDSISTNSGYGLPLMVNKYSAQHVQQGIYFRYYMKYASNYWTSSYDGGKPMDNDKWVKISGNNANIEIVAYRANANGYTGLFFHPLPADLNRYVSMDFPFGKWNKVEMYLYVPSSGGTPYVHIQVNDSDVLSESFPGLYRGPYSSVLQLFNGVRASNMGGPPSGKGYRYFDDLTVVVGEGDLCNREPAEPGSGVVMTEPADVPPPSNLRVMSTQND
jgi:hypothetical protein